VGKGTGGALRVWHDRHPARMHSPAHRDMRRSRSAIGAHVGFVKPGYFFTITVGMAGSPSSLPSSALSP
jgi:hypothetical protein